MNLIDKLREIFYPLFPVRVAHNPSQLLQTVAEKFNQPEEIHLHSQDVTNGLEEWEKDFLVRFMKQRGSVLDVGCGAGREAIALTRLGFEVTGIDIADKMIEVARKNAAISGVKIKFEVKSTTEIDYPFQSFNYILFSRAIYSYIPTRCLRISVLKSVKKVLKSEGVAVFSAYYYGKRKWFSRTYPLDSIRKCLRFLVGNRFRTEPGDILFRRVSEASNPRKLCFGHFFSSPQEVLEEIQTAGLKVIEGEKTGFWVLKP